MLHHAYLHPQICTSEVDRRTWVYGRFIPKETHLFWYVQLSVGEVGNWRGNLRNLPVDMDRQCQHVTPPGPSFYFLTIEKTYSITKMLKAPRIRWKAVSAMLCPEKWEAYLSEFSLGTCLTHHPLAQSTLGNCSGSSFQSSSCCTTSSRKKLPSSSFQANQFPTYTLW